MSGDSSNSFVVGPCGELFTCWAGLGTTGQPVCLIGDRAGWLAARAGWLEARAGWSEARAGWSEARDPFDDPGGGLVRAPADVPRRLP